MQKAVAERLLGSLTDEDILDRVRSGETALYELLMRRYNERVFRAARAILKNDDEAEEALQETFVRAFHALDRFEGRARFSTWLLRIAVNEALARRRSSLRLVSLDEITEEGTASVSAIPSNAPSAEDDAARREITTIMTRALDALDESLRIVFTLREIEELSTRETARILDLSEANVKVRLHRARAELRGSIERAMGAEAVRLYAFHLSRCDRCVARVFERISGSLLK